MRPRGSGALPDGPDARDLTAITLLGAVRVAAPPEAHSGISTHIGYIADQGARNSCVGEALSQALFARQSLEGRHAVRPSAALIYYLARSSDGLESSDFGCRPRAAYRALRSVGYCAENVWPREVGVAVKPHWEVYRATMDQHAVEFYRVRTTGAARCDEIRAALVAGFPVTLALQTDPGYQHTAGAWAPSAIGIHSGHYVCATHYDRSGLWHVGSYGADWGLHGFCRVPWNVIGDPDITSDVWVVTLAPAPPAEAQA